MWFDYCSNDGPELYLELSSCNFLQSQEVQYIDFVAIFFKVH